MYAEAVGPIQSGGDTTIREKQQGDSLKWFILFTTGLMVLGFLSGALWPDHFSAAMKPALEQLKKLAEGAGDSTVRTWFLIFWHNVLTAGMLMITGVFLGIFPAISMWYNGLLMGYVTMVGAHNLHAPGWKVFALSMLPHGLFELPAIIWSSALGVQLGFSILYSLTRYFRSLVKGGPLPTRSRLTIRGELHRIGKHIPYIVLLLFIAAAIESTITPELIKWGLVS